MCHEHSKMVKTTLQVRSLRLDLSTGRLGSGPTARTSIIIWIEANDAHYLMSVGSNWPGVSLWQIKKKVGAKVGSSEQSQTMPLLRFSSFL
jgi:hypothetical protein